MKPISTPIPSTTLKTGDEITQDGKKYRVTLEEIPQYDFKPGMICVVDWDGSEFCTNHSNNKSVVYIGHNNGRNPESIAFATNDGRISIGYVKTSSLRPV